MAEYTLFTDFTTLSKKDADDFVANFGRLANDTFQNKSNQLRILGNLLVLEQYFNTLCQAMTAKSEEPIPIVHETIDMLWDYLYGKIEIHDFEDLANNIYACVLSYMVGEELTDEQYEFYEKYFDNSEDNLFQWNVISWVSTLFMELTAIHGGRLDFDEFECCEYIDFVEIDEMLNVLSDACIEFTDIERKSNMAKDVIEAFENVYITPLFQSIIYKVQKGLKDAINAEVEDYEKLRNEYKNYTILPEEFAVAFLEF